MRKAKMLSKCEMRNGNKSQPQTKCPAVLSEILPVHIQAIYILVIHICMHIYRTLCAWAIKRCMADIAK